MKQESIIMKNDIVIDTLQDFQDEIFEEIDEVDANGQFKNNNKIAKVNF